MNPWEPYVLAIAAALGAYIRARWTAGQANWNRETMQDCFFAAMLGMLWAFPLDVTLPGIGVELAWPPFQLPAKMPLPVRAALMALLASLFIGVIKKVLLQFPALFEKVTGTAAPVKPPEPPAKGAGDAPKP